MAATIELKNIEGKRGAGFRAVIGHINEEILSSENDKKLMKICVHFDMCRGQFGVSPVKNGRPPSNAPTELTLGLACHAAMMQIAGKGGAFSLKMPSNCSGNDDGNTTA